MSQRQDPQLDFSYGMARDVSPHRIDKRALYDLRNGFYDDDGGISTRGGSRPHSALGSSFADGFETDLSAWTNNSSGTGTRDNDWASEGSWSAVLENFLVVESFDSDPVAVSPGDEAVVTLDFNLEAGNWSAAIGFDTGTGTQFTVLPLGEGSTEVVALAPPGSSEMNVRIFSFSNGGNRLSIDNVKVSVIPIPNEFVWDGYFDAGRRTVFASQDDFGVLGSDDESVVNLGSTGLTIPAPSALLESLLFIGGGFIYGGSRKTANYSTGTVTLTNGSKTVTGSGTSFSANIDPGMLIQRGNERVYVVASVESNTSLTLRDAYEGVNGMGLAYTARPFYTITTADPYESGDWYAICQNRLVTSFENVLKFTEIQKPHKWTLTAGDPPAEIPNTHEVSDGTRILGAAAVGQTLLILSTHGAWALDGLSFDIVDSQGNTNHRLKVLSRDLIGYGNGIASWDQALVIPCVDSVYLLDGVSSPTRISSQIDELYRTYMSQGYQPGQATVYRGHYILPIITAGGKVIDTLVCRLDRPVKGEGRPIFPWSHFNGRGMECPAYTVRTEEAPAQPKLLGASSSLGLILECSGFFEPDAGNQTDADGQAPVWVLDTRDYETGGLTTNMVRYIRHRTELVGDGAQIESYYGFGLRNQSGALWDQVAWDEFDWTDDNEDVYYALDCPAGESEGITPHFCDVNDEGRFIRYRFLCKTPRSKLNFRTLEQFVRESRAIRR